MDKIFKVAVLIFLMGYFAVIYNQTQRKGVEVGRYQLCARTYQTSYSNPDGQASEKQTPAFLKIDTATGRTWMHTSLITISKVGDKFQACDWWEEITGEIKERKMPPESKAVFSQ